VIIPAFKAEQSLGQTVQSVLHQPEVEEVLIIEDGSPDNTLDLCRELERQNDRVTLLRHASGGNLGVAATRNLGIEAAISPYISFLDADDVALPNRFSLPVTLLESQPEIDGVYEAVGLIHSETPNMDWAQVVDPPLLTLVAPVPPERFLEALLTPGTGTVHTNGFVVRRSVFDRVGRFRSVFEPAEDMHLFWRFAAACAMVPGRLTEAVAIYRRHTGSLSIPTDPVYLEDPFRRALDLCAWARGRDDVSHLNRKLLKRILIHNIAAWWGGPISQLTLRKIQLRRWFQAAVICPSVVMAPKIWLGAVGLKKDPELACDPVGRRSPDVGR
jgi:glycosyltransferase involved in cell wall biosynthesis